MAGETTGAPETGTSAEEQHEAPGSGQGFDYERAYGELRPEYTRATQAVSDYERLFAGLRDPDPEVQRAAAQELGLEFVEETGPPQTGAGGAEEEWIDPLEEELKELRGTVDQLRDKASEADRREQEQELEDLQNELIGAELTAIEERTHEQLSEEEEQLIGDLSLAMLDDEGMPDVQGAYMRVFGDQGVFTARQQGLFEKKRGVAQAPSGRQVTTKPKLDNREARVNYMDERWRQLNDEA